MFQFLNDQLGFTSIRLIIAIPVLLAIILGSTYLIRKLMKDKYAKQIDVLEYDFSSLMDRINNVRWDTFMRSMEHVSEKSKEQNLLIDGHEQLLIQYASGVAMIKEFKENGDREIKELSSLASYVSGVCEKLEDELKDFEMNLELYINANPGVMVYSDRKAEAKASTQPSFAAKQEVPTATLKVDADEFNKNTLPKTEEKIESNELQIKKEVPHQEVNMMASAELLRRRERVSNSDTRKEFEELLSTDTQVEKKESKNMEFMNNENGMENPGSKYVNPNQGSVITEGIVINGDLSANVPLVVGGKVTGTISSSTTVSLVSGADIQGDINVRNLVTEGGVVQGNISSKEQAMIEQGTFVVGNIQGSDLTIKGDVHGDITSYGEVSFASTAQVVGDIKASSLDIKKGAKIRGSFVIGEDIDF